MAVDFVEGRKRHLGEMPDYITILGSMVDYHRESITLLKMCDDALEKAISIASKCQIPENDLENLAIALLKHRDLRDTIRQHDIYKKEDVDVDNLKEHGF
jgi:hypothetical protein